MSRSNWGKIRAIGRGLIEKPSYRQLQEEAERKRNEAQQHADRKQIIITLERLVELRKAATNQKESTERAREKWEVPPYWKEYVGTVNLWVAAGVGLASIVVVSGDANKQLKAMNDQLNVMRAEQRPWIGAPTKVDGKKGPNGTAEIYVTMQNTGHLPPKKFAVDGEIRDANENEWSGATQHFCTPLKDKARGNVYSAFPGADWRFDADQMPNYQGTPPRHTFPNFKAIKAMANPYFIGCAVYAYEHKEDEHKVDNWIWHQTGFGVHLVVENDKIVADRTYASHAD